MGSMRSTARDDGDSTTQPVLALALLMPAFAALVYSYLRPTAWTVNASFEARRLLNQSPERVGLANYRQVLGEGWLAGAGHILTYALVPALMLVTVAPLLAWLVSRTGDTGRRIARVALAVPLACLAPVAAAAGWRLTSPRHVAGGVVDPTETRLGYWVLAALIAGATGATAYLLAYQRPAGGRPAWVAVTSLGGLGVLATVAVAMQEFTYPWLGLPPEGGPTPAASIVNATVSGFDLGPGSAAAVLLMAPLLLLGVGAALLVILARLRIEVHLRDEPPTPAPRLGWPAIIVADLLLLALLGLFGYVARPVVQAWASGPESGPSLATLLSNTWLPPLSPTVVGVGLAAVAGFAIGGLRPLGPWSELLLLPFAPWLFVGSTPLLVSAFADSLASNRIDSGAGLVPPSWLCIPALFLFTLLCRGLHRRRGELRAVGLDPRTATERTYLAVGLPALLVTLFAVWLIRVQELAWPLVAAGPLTPTATTEVADALNGGGEGVWLLPVLLPAIPALVVFIAAQIRVADRLTLRAGRTACSGGNPG